jgi:hypothetical protein
MTEETTSKRRPKGARVWIGIVAAILVVVLVVSLVVVLGLHRDTAPKLEASPTPEPAVVEPSETPSPTPTPAQPEFYAEAAFDAWQVTEPSDVGTQFSSNGETVTDGASSLRIDSTTVAVAPHAGLSQTVRVTPATQYNFSAWILSPDDRPNSEPVSIAMNGSTPEVHSFPEGITEWTPVSWTYTTSADQSELPLTITPNGQVSGFVLDQLVVSPASGSRNLIANGSFEEFDSPRYLTNETLILTAGTATLDVAWYTRNVNWSVTNERGEVVVSGVQPTDGGIAEVPLQALPQGFYSFSASAPDSSASAIETDFMILNDEHAPYDERFGVAAKIYRPLVDGVEKATGQVGITSVRSDANWSIEQVPGNYDFDPRWDTLFKSFGDQSVSVLPISMGKNPNFEDERIPSTQEGIAAYSAFTEALVSRFESPAVEIQNELNSKRFNNSRCGITAACYLPLLKGAHDAVKATHPDTLVVGPANANQDDPFLTELYRLGGLEYLDVVSYHPYEATPEQLIGNIQNAQNRIKEYSNGVDKQLWLTEFGWTSNNGDASEVMQANYLVRAQVIAFANGVDRAYWYNLVNESTDGGDHEGNFGLFREKSEAVPAFEPKLSAATQALLIRMIGGKAFAATEIDNGAYVYLFGEGSDSVRVAWSTSGSTVRFESATPLTVTSATGAVSELAPVDGSVTVELGERPVYITGAASPGVIQP